MEPMDTTLSSAPGSTSPPPPSTSSASATPPQPPQQPHPQLLPSTPPLSEASTLPPQQTLARPQFHTPPQPSQRLPLARPRPPYSTFSQHPSSPMPSSSSSSSLSVMTTSTSGAMQRGGMALGVPAQPRVQQQGGPVPFSSFGPNPSFGQPFGGMNPRAVEQSATSSSQVRTPIQGIQTIGMVGSLSTASTMRPSGLPAHHQIRPGQMPLRSTSPASTQPVGPQKLPSQGLTRASSTASLSSQSTGQLQNPQSLQQPWISAQGKPLHGLSMPPPAYRPQVRPQQLPQRPPLPQQASQVQHQQFQQKQQQQQAQVQAKTPQTGTQQQLSSRVLGTANQKVPMPSAVQPGAGQPGASSPVDVADTGDHILSKRSIHELVAQVDPSEKLDPEVEDILVEIADDFVESITTVACSLAKHRKSTILEAKDILLHLERNWNMTLPGFGGEEIKYYKKPLTNEIHKDRLAAIKKSMITPELGNPKSSTPGQIATNAKSHPVKVPAIGSPKLS